MRCLEKVIYDVLEKWVVPGKSPSDRFSQGGSIFHQFPSGPELSATGYWPEQKKSATMELWKFYLLEIEKHNLGTDANSTRTNTLIKSQDFKNSKYSTLLRFCSSNAFACS